MAPPELSAAREAPSPTVASAHADPHRSRHGDLWSLALGAVGVVYGDIGTSPLYAIKECFAPTHGVSPTPENILGILSLVLWSITVVVSVKYLLFVMRVDNNASCPRRRRASTSGARRSSAPRPAAQWRPGGAASSRSCRATPGPRRTSSRRRPTASSRSARRSSSEAPPPTRAAPRVRSDRTPTGGARATDRLTRGARSERCCGRLPGPHRRLSRGDAAGPTPATRRGG